MNCSEVSESYQPWIVMKVWSVVHTNEKTCTIPYQQYIAIPTVLCKKIN